MNIPSTIFTYVVVLIRGTASQIADCDFIVSQGASQMGLLMCG